MEIRQGTLVVVLGIEVNQGTSGHGPLGEEIGLVLGVHDGNPFVRTKFWTGHHPEEKLIPICQTALNGDGESERIICDEDSLNELLLRHFPEIIVNLAMQIKEVQRDLRARTDWLAENK